MIRVLVVEDEPLVRSGIAALLGGHEDIEVVAEAADGLTAIAQAASVEPDLVLMDLRIPGVDGVEATRLLTAETVETRTDRLLKVLALTTFTDDESVYGVLKAGASGFLVKSSAPAHLVEAIRAVAGGDCWLDSSVAGRVLCALHHVPHPGNWAPGLIDQLSPREQEVLALMAHGLTNAEISGRFTLSEATVKTHVHRILMKTGSRDRSQAVVLAYRSGFVRS